MGDIVDNSKGSLKEENIQRSQEMKGEAMRGNRFSRLQKAWELNLQEEKV